MPEKSFSDLEQQLLGNRNEVFEKAKNLFAGKAVESHIFGSLARGDADAFSDIDIWFTFKDEDFDEIYKNRLEYYRPVGDILHICEAPQNAPIGGVHSALLVRSEDGVIGVIDIYLCPFTTSFIPAEGKKLYGIDLPMGAIGLNPQKVTVDKDYRVDFFICFIFGTIKKLARNSPDPLGAVRRQYEHLYTNYGIQVEPVTSTEQSFSALQELIEEVMKVANEKQQKTLNEILNFIQITSPKVS